jgi:hypothetical protein
MKKGSPSKFPGTVAAFLFLGSSVLLQASQDSGLRLNAAPGTNQHLQLTLTGEPSVAYVIESSPNLQNWAPVITNDEPAITRVLSVDATNDSAFYRARRGPLPLYFAALAAAQNIDFLGYPILVDSFDSSDPNYSTNGVYEPTRNKDGGDVVTDGNSGIALNVENASILGHVRTGPGSLISIGPQGSVGSKPWVTGGNTGIEPGWSSYDMNVAFPDVRSPDLIYNYPTWFSSMPPGGTVDVGGGIIMSFNSVVSSSGTSYYQVSSLPGSIYIGTNANVVLWITGNVTNYNKVIAIAPVGASLTIYLSGSFSPTGAGAINNYSQKAENVYILGLPTCTSINLAGSASFIGVVYAPEANLSFGGSAFVGSYTANNISIVGHLNFHFDENLKSVGPSR